ncbi:MAG: PP2C family protein-serine/threonine phosphatase [Planctomycetales bacterium]
MPFEVRWGSVTITGNFRENNEDRCLTDSAGRFFLVADGMGGQCAGEKASAMAVELIPSRLEQLLDFSRDEGTKVARCIDEAVAYANGEIMASSELNPEFHNMGTTLALVVRVGDRFYVAGVGDSRVYLFRAGKLKRLTLDHSLTQALLDAGTISAEEAARHRYRNVLYRFLGTKEGGTGAKAEAVDMRAGDRLILCSDGATDGLSDEMLQAIIARHSDPQSAAQEIVHAAEQAGSRDNITCVSIFVD